MDHTEKDMNYAVVLGDRHFNSLGLVRSLGEAGVTVYFLNFGKSAFADDSMYTKKHMRVGSEADVRQALSEIAHAESGKGVIFPSSDQAALVLDSLREALADDFIVPHAGGQLAKLMEKDTMCELAGKFGFNVPEGFEISADNVDLLVGIDYPLILKPLASVEGVKTDICVCENGTEASASVQSLLAAGYKRLLVQRFVSSDNELMVEYIGCKVKGTPVQLFGQLEKIREYPFHRGSTSFACIVEKITYIDPSALDRFLDAAGFEGLFDLEIKVVDDKAWFIEINFRNGAPLYAFTAAGFNVPYVWYCLKTGLPFKEIKIRELLLMSERDDLNHVIDKNISLFKWLKDVRRTDVFMIFNRKDSAPFRRAYNGAVDLAVRVIGKKLR